MIEQDGKFMPNFKFRYLFEDVPFGMAVIKGIASLAGVATPKLDMVRKPGGSLNKKNGVDRSCTEILKDP